MPNNANILAYAPGASYLAANDVRKSGLYNNSGRTNPILPQQIYAIYFVIKKIYDLDPNYPGMTVACQYLWEIMGRYGLKAIGLTGNGGSVTPINPSIPEPAPYDFIVSDSTFVVTGQSVKYFPIVWIGWNLQFARGSVLQSITVPDFGSYFDWNINTAKLTMLAVGGADPSAQEGERFQFWPVGGSGSGGGSAGTVIVSPIRITGADFATATEWDGQNSGSVTVASSYTLQVFYNDINRFLEENSEWQRTTDGIEILLAGFDSATTNINSVFYIYMSA